MMHFTSLHVFAIIYIFTSNSVTAVKAQTAAGGRQQEELPIISIRLTTKSFGELLNEQ